MHNASGGSILKIWRLTYSLLATKRAQKVNEYILRIYPLTFCASIRQRELVLSFMINFRWIKLILITLEFDIRSEQVALGWKTLTREVVRNGMNYRRG